MDTADTATVDGRVFNSTANTRDGDVGGETYFWFDRSNDVVHAQSGVGLDPRFGLEFAEHTDRTPAPRTTAVENSHRSIGLTLRDAARTIEPYGRHRTMSLISSSSLTDSLCHIVASFAPEVSRSLDERNITVTRYDSVTSWSRESF